MGRQKYTSMRTIDETFEDSLEEPYYGSGGYEDDDEDTGWQEYPEDDE